MKNILLVTNLYPMHNAQILNNTAVCHYFAKEWMKLGYNVRVIFNYNQYPRLYYPILKLFKKKLANKYGIAILAEYINEMNTYYYEEVKVTCIPIYKLKPGGEFAEKTINRQVALIKEILDNEKFLPDVILGHFMHPTLEVIVKLKKIYNTKVALNLHGKVQSFKRGEKELLSSVDYVGFRSQAIKASFEKFYGIFDKTYLCPSGVPNNFYTLNRTRNYEKPLNIIYIGNLIKRKHPTAIVSALSLLNKTHFRVKYVGDGDERSNIIKIAGKNCFLSNVEFTGQIPRQEIISHLDSSDVFIMISEAETFGLVYLEAMARGCIVVASKNEGMDGIIKHGVNGFLCEAGNANMLADILTYIDGLSVEEMIMLSNNSRKTAEEYTDKKVAMHYLSEINHL